MPLRVWNGSSWVTAKSGRVWNGSSWVRAKSAKVWNGSSWVNFLSSVNITNLELLASGSGFGEALGIAGYTLFNNGSAQGYENTGFLQEYPISGQWFVGGAISDFSVKATIVSERLGIGGGTGYTGTFGSWLALTTTRNWELTQYVNGFNRFETSQLVFDVDIAYTNDTSKIIDTARITLQATAQTA